jgi:Tol biopolymer transport system component
LVRDMAVYVGASYQLGARAADRFGNPRSEPVALRSLTPGVVTVTDARVTAAAVGRGRVLMQASSGTATDTAYVSVPPPGRLVAWGWSGDEPGLTRLTLVNTDGSARRVILSTSARNHLTHPAWSPDGSRIVYQDASAPEYREQLHVTDTLGSGRPLLPNPAELPLSMQPAFSADGAALYFLGSRTWLHAAAIYRANPDGTGAQFLFAGVQPAPSPDGSRIAYVSGTTLFLRDVATGQASPVATDPELPRWAPSGDLIAFVSYPTGELRVVRPDGTGLRTVGPGFRTSGGVSWSPDGAWLVAAGSRGGLELIRVADGERLPLPATEDLVQPDWRP